ncbi:hypothetical protein SERLADRAFT_362463 [Serpula lacrymans var. lacrymans S7.9]|nr:uncharacterized protein SERLADRAFT_362463 [Serpula lacrymans var. lacrymans S7.9]EGO23231.1 hypothetical protein SERLADRAFT_362463 [Serpula lacrymans var. lacrymans S7.9]
MSRNEAQYPNASEFVPERFFKPDGKLNVDATSYIFGFGRRVCAGQHVANAAVWIAIVSCVQIYQSN